MATTFDVIDITGTANSGDIIDIGEASSSYTVGQSATLLGASTAETSGGSHNPFAAASFAVTIDIPATQISDGDYIVVYDETVNTVLGVQLSNGTASGSGSGGSFSGGAVGGF